MPDWLRIGDPSINIRLRRDRRARRFVLRVSSSGNAPVLTMPAAASVSEVRRFAAEHEGWLRSKLAARLPTTLLKEGALLPVGGREFALSTGQSARLCPEVGILELPGPAARLAAQAAGFLRAYARENCSEAVARHSAALEMPHGRITLRDTRSRWGSCTSRGDLMFSWRLAMAPPKVLDYVVAHEVAHLKEMNHSARFWTTVARLMPDYARPREWLRAHGAGLHRYAFQGIEANTA